ncbi:MAG: hypothetical protein ACI4D8_00250, partial [Wujia sp.]
ELPQSTNSDVVCTAVEEYNVSLAEINTLIDANASQSIIDEKKAHQMKQCTVYVYDSASGSVTTAQYYKGDDRTVQYAVFEYMAYKYTLENVKLGSRKTEYSRTVVLDDLENKLQNLVDSSDTDYTYSIIYDDSIDVEGFTRDDAGKLVKYNDLDNNGEIDGDDTLYPSGVLVKKVKASSVSDPNQVNMGNMQNLEVDKVAMLTGESTMYDEVVANEFYTQTMNILKTSESPIQREIYENELNNPGNLLLYADYLNNMMKLTTITIEDDVANSCYRVSFYVSYENTLLGKKIKKTYLIKSLEYKYDASDKNRKCPDIYVEYQPFASINTYGTEGILDDELTYSEHEYILIDNRILAEEDTVKVYLYKPNIDQAATFYGFDSTSNPYPNSFFVMNSMDDPYKTSSTRKARLHILNAVTTGDTEIYTNIDLSPCFPSGTYACTDNNHETHTTYNPQFLFTDTENAFASNFYVDDTTPRTVYEFDSSKLKSVADDTSVKDKLFNVTVYLTPVSANVNSVVLSGAKGED